MKCANFFFFGIFHINLNERKFSLAFFPVLFCSSFLETCELEMQNDYQDFRWGWEGLIGAEPAVYLLSACSC